MNFSRIFCLVSIAASVLLFGCGGENENKVGDIKLLEGDNQCVPPSTLCEKEISAELLAPRKKGLFGGKGTQDPIGGMKVRFAAGKDSDLEITPVQDVSDAGGRVRARVKTGRKLGDQYVKIIPEGFEGAAKTVRIINGIAIEGNDQEAYAGHLVSEPISVKVFNPDGLPADGVSVFFTVVSHPGKKNDAKCKSSVKTDSEGRAETTFKTGDSTGTYKVLIEFEDPKRHFVSRGIEITEFSKNIFGIGGLVLTVLGGLAIFIFGMVSMTDGLQLVAGDQMKKILKFFTSNRVIAVLAGTMVTGVIQSSSACTVMVVGFVNAGLLTLRQAIGVIFGANIGTTVTAQIISFNIEESALPAITIGLLLYLLGKKMQLKGWGQTLLGFGMLFLGLGIMSDELKLISRFPSIIDFFARFDCTPANGFMPIGAVLGAIAIGTFMTCIIQSSSATIGIALALASSGLINFYTAVPLILGDNIGTTITANFAALGANRRSKQAALAHFLFNIIGTTYMFVLFYFPFPSEDGIPVYLKFINSITPGDVFAPIPENITRHIAMAHTMFNVFNVILLLPFIGAIERACTAIIKIRDVSAIKINPLEPHLLETPSVAIEQTINSLRYMVGESWKMVSAAMEQSLKTAKTDKELSNDLAAREIKIDEMQMDIADYLVELTSRRLTEPQAEIIPLLIHCSNDAERIADHTANILSLAEKLEKYDRHIPNSISTEIDELWQIVSDQARHVTECLQNTDNSNVIMALSDENKINNAVAALEKKNVKQMRKGKTDAVTGTIVLEILTEIEKIGDHLTNIAERAPEIQRHHLKLG